MASLAAQTGGSGTLKGTVTDPWPSSVIPGATVTAIHTATGVENKRTATAAGLFVIAPLPTGTYNLRVGAPGFRPLTKEQIIVDSLSTAELTLKLEVGTTAESVTVSAVPPELNTADARGPEDRHLSVLFTDGDLFAQHPLATQEMRSTGAMVIAAYGDHEPRYIATDIPHWQSGYEPNGLRE